ncbi:putative gustatory receptor 59c [Drosophila pseudoobscura]|uniref:Gustatory receptor n=1 Tax=Drosophila pseudoobscura pseudoobscura TaxID=46245 RepID=A0A6I8UT82_DROPS|nr:putative gustatory receptor 59c [Drosophila pseudoobscura]
MADFVWIIQRFVYLYGRLVGVVNFTVDWRTGRAMITRWATIQAAVQNICLIGLLTFQLLHGDTVLFTFKHAKYLHEYVFLMVTAVRHWAVLLTLVSRWRHRGDIVLIWNRLFRATQQRPDVIPLYRRRLILKFIFAVLSDNLHMVLDLSALRQKFSPALVLKLIVWYLFTTIFNMIVAQYYLAMLQVNVSYTLIKRDLRELLTETQALCGSTNRRGGVFVTKCCALSDRLDRIAETQSKLQALVDGMSKIFQIQSFSMTIVYYLSTIGTIYFAFCTIKYSSTGLGASNWGLLLIVLSTTFFYADNFITINIGFIIMDSNPELMKILEERTLLCEELDERLKSSFESFQLQLARNPLEFYVMGLFKIDRGRIMSMANSLITHSIILIQWELQNN